MKMEIEVVSEWKDHFERFAELRIDKYQACCVKETVGGSFYVLQCENGQNVYSAIGGADFPLRSLTAEEEVKVIAFAKNLFGLCK